MSPYCSRKECNPLLPLLGTTKLIREYCKNLEYGKCPKCKSVFDINIMTDGNHKLLDREILCPKCRTELKPEKHWNYKCSKCGTYY